MPNLSRKIEALYSFLSTINKIHLKPEVCHLLCFRQCPALIWRNAGDSLTLSIMLIQILKITSFTYSSDSIWKRSENVLITLWKRYHLPLIIACRENLNLLSIFQHITCRSTDFNLTIVNLDNAQKLAILTIYVILLKNGKVENFF